MKYLAVTQKFIFKPSMWTIYDQTIVSGSNFLALLLVARELGAEVFGLVALAYAVTLFLSNHQRAYFTQPFNVQYATRSSEETAEHLGSLFKLHIAWIPIGFLIIIAGGLIFYPEPEVIVVACLFFLLHQIQELIRRNWYTTGETHKVFFNDCIAYGGKIIFLLLLMYFDSLTSVTAFLAFSSAMLIAIVHAKYLRFTIRWSNKRSLKDVAVQHWRFGQWLVLGVFTVWGASQLYPFMISSLGSTVVGAFVAARNITNIVNIALQSINSYMPRVAKQILQNNGPNALQTYASKVTLYVAIFIGIPCFLISHFSESVLLLVYGQEYVFVAQSLPWLAFGAFMAALSSVSNSVLLVLERTKLIFLANILSTIFSLTFGFVLVSEYGYMGAAYGVAFSLTLNCLFQFFSMKRALAQYSRQVSS